MQFIIDAVQTKAI